MSHVEVVTTGLGTHVSQPEEEDKDEAGEEVGGRMKGEGRESLINISASHLQPLPSPTI